jgi:pimeloyl-ACP methyl ester carboxylesterase
MQRFRSWDGTELAYQAVGSGPPVVCIPGGPGQAVEYLGELGGLSDHRTLILLDNRGTGASQAPQDPTTYRVDRLVQDVEALRGHLGLDRMDLFGHSASGGICLLYAAEHPHRLDHLVLVGPSLRVIGLPSDLGIEQVLARREHEPWYAEAVAALHAEAASPQELQKYRWGSGTPQPRRRRPPNPPSSPNQRPTGSTPASNRTRPCQSDSKGLECRRC